MATKHETRAIRRVQIMEAAGKLIVRRGSEHLTVRSIAGEVNISEAAIYRHFRSKKDILALLADYIGDNLVGELDDLAAREAPGALGAVLQSHIAAIERRRGTSFQVIAEIISFGDRELNAKASQAVGKYTARLEKLLQDAAQAGLLQAEAGPGAAAKLIASLIQGLVNTWVLSNYTLDLRQEFAVRWRVLASSLLNPTRA